MTKTFVNHVFVTLTFARTDSSEKCWLGTMRSFNRFITNYRRLHRDGCEYIRTVESHEDGYPHLHAVIQHKSVLTVDAGRYFDRELYQKWRRLWSYGHSDFQVPRIRHSVFYCIKYISKDSTKRTLWRKMYQDDPSSKSAYSQIAENTIAPLTTPKSSVLHASNMDARAQSALTKADLTTFLCKQYKIKQCTWSRGFKFPRLERKVVPLPSQCLLTPAL